MKKKLQKKLVMEGPILYKHFKDNPKNVIDCPDDLFEFIFELSVKIEDFNKRFPRRLVRAMKVAMESGQLVFVTNKQVFTIRKLINITVGKIKSYRRLLRQSFIERAKTMGTMALFESRLIPDWKRQMSDELETLRKIFEIAEKYACVPDDYKQLSMWYKKYLNDEEKMEFFQQKLKGE